MQDGDRFMLSDTIDQTGLVVDFSFDDWSPFNETSMARREVVEADWLIPRAGQNLAAMGTDVTGTAHDKNATSLTHLNYPVPAVPGLTQHFTVRLTPARWLLASVLP